MFEIKKMMKNTFVILLVYMFVTYMIPFHKSVAAANITVTGPSVIIEGQSAVFNVTYSNDVIYINLSSGDIVLKGFQATVSVSGSGNSRKIVLTNVRGVGSDRSIAIASGTGYVGAEKISGTISNTFKIKSAVVQNQNNNTQTNTTNNANNTNNNVQKPAVNNTNNNNLNNNNSSNTNNNNNNNNNNNTVNQNNNEAENNTQTETTEKPSEEVKEETPEEVKPEENINYDEVIPIPNTGK